MTLSQQFVDHLSDIMEGLLVSWWPVLILTCVVGVLQWIGNRWLTSRQLCWLWGLVLLRLMLPFVPHSPLSVMNLFASDADPLSPVTHGLDVNYAVMDSTRWEQTVTVPVNDAPALSILSRIEILVLDHLTLMWFVGLVTVLLWTWIVQLRFSLAIRAAKPCDDGRLIALFNECRRHMYVRSSVELMLLDDQRHPALYRFWKPAILLPTDASNKSDEELRMMLLHELAHLRRYDILGNWILVVLHAMHWWNPLYYIAVANYRRCREQDCDAIVIDQIGRQHTTAYGELLLHYATVNAPWRRVILPASILGFFSSALRKRALKSRLLALKQAGVARTLYQPAIVVLLMLVIVLTGMTDAEERQPQPPAPPFSLSEISVSSPVPNDESPGPSLTVLYEIEPALQAYRQQFPDAQQEVADEMFLVLVRQMVAGEIGTTLGKEGEAGNDSKGFICQLFDENKMVVRGTQAQHAELKRLLPLWNEGIDVQHVIECRLMSSRLDLSTFVGIAWKPLASAPLPASPVSVSTQGEAQEPTVTAQTAIEQHQPILFAVIDDAKSQELMNKLQADVRSNILLAPNVTVLNGQLASIWSGSQRPFVVGMKSTTDGTLEPELKVIKDGLELDLRATSRQGVDKTELQSTICLSSVEEVSTFTSQVNGKPVTIQMPEVRKFQMQTTTALNSKESLLVGLVPTKERPEFIYVMLTVSRLKME